MTGTISKFRDVPLISVDGRVHFAAVLAPVSAAKHYGLKILHSVFEDEEAITTFFLLGPRSKPRALWGKYRSLFVFKTAHTPGAFARALTPFSEAGVNLIHMPSLYTGNGGYDFAVETEFGPGDAGSHETVIEQVREFVDRSILFGLFPIVEQ